MTSFLTVAGSISPAISSEVTLAPQWGAFFAFVFIHMVFPMTYHFTSPEQYNALWQAVHDACLYWKKVKQDAEGKISLQCDGSRTHYSHDEACENLRVNALLLKQIEDSPHWRGVERDDETVYVPIEREEYNGSMVTKSLRQTAHVADQV